MREYQPVLLNDFMQKTELKDFKDKVILEIGSDMRLNIAQLFVNFGAKEVYCVNPLFPDDLTSPDSKIKLVKDFGEKVKLKSHYFDCIFGIALLEHVLNTEDLFLETKRMLKKDGYAYLQGNPMYTCHCGHHVWAQTPEIHYKFCDETNPFEPWEHLTLHTKQEYIENLKHKNISEEHIEKILGYVLSNDTSKIPPSAIAKTAKDVFKQRLSIFRQVETESANEFYNIAKNFYSEEDLNTTSLTLLIRPEQDNQYQLLCKKIAKTITLLKLTYF